MQPLDLLHNIQVRYAGIFLFTRLSHPVQLDRSFTGMQAFGGETECPVELPFRISLISDPDATSRRGRSSHAHRERRIPGWDESESSSSESEPDAADDAADPPSGPVACATTSSACISTEGAERDAISATRASPGLFGALARRQRDRVKWDERLDAYLSAAARAHPLIRPSTSWRAPPGSCSSAEAPGYRVVNSLAAFRDMSCGRQLVVEWWRARAMAVFVGKRLRGVCPSTGRIVRWCRDRALTPPLASVAALTASRPWPWCKFCGYQHDDVDTPQELREAERVCKRARLVLLGDADLDSALSSRSSVASALPTSAMRDALLSDAAGAKQPQELAIMRQSATLSGVALEHSGFGRMSWWQWVRRSLAEIGIEADARNDGPRATEFALFAVRDGCNAWR
jgi:hypothetical protein